ncbi:hypothetical protein [Persicitalea sp.]|uniref:hypothetical protein n=1 Tax=Persicitalea sp. TaxID=3100273 RepID=UPI00359347D2
MSFNIRPTRTFQKQFKQLLKKYRSLTLDILVLRSNLAANPVQGTSIGKNCFKIRLAISSKNQGKSGGARVITNVHIVGETVYLLSIYDKSSKGNLDEGELERLLLEIDD